MFLPGFERGPAIPGSAGWELEFCSSISYSLQFELFWLELDILTSREKPCIEWCKEAGPFSMDAFIFMLFMRPNNEKPRKLKSFYTHSEMLENKQIFIR